MLPQLREFMKHSLPGIKVVTLDCMADKEKMDKWKTEQRERKKVEGGNIAVVQGGRGSMSSSDISDLDDQEQQIQESGPAQKTTKEKVLGSIEAPLDQVKNIKKGEAGS